MARQSFPQGQAPPLFVEIDLEGGIDLHNPPSKLFRQAASVGLRKSQGVVWQPEYTDAASPERNGLGMLPAPMFNTAYTFSGTLPETILGMIPSPVTRNRNLLVGIESSLDIIAVWRIPTAGGAAVLQTISHGTATSFSKRLSMPISQAFWRAASLNVEARDLDGNGSTDHAAVTTALTGLTFFSHPGQDKIWYFDNQPTNGTNASSGTSGTLTNWYIRSYTNAATDPDLTRRMDYGSMAPPAGASALIVYLDRLWMAVPSTTGDTLGKSTLIYYTDPSNWRMIRPENFITVEDEVTALATPVSGGIGVGGQAQLVIIGIDSVSVLDGDPTLGNSILRTLSENIGGSNTKCVVETPYGIVLASTKGQVYLIPPGAQRLIPIGKPIESVIENSSTAISGQPPIQLFWQAPYVLLMMGEIQKVYVFDLSNPENPKWWGPLVGDETGYVIGQSRSASLASGVNDTTAFYSTYPLTLSNTARESTISMTSTNTPGLYLVGRQAIIETGVIMIPSKKVELKSVYIVRPRKTTLPTLTVTATTSEGQTLTAIKYGANPTMPVNASAVDDPRFPVVEKYIFTDKVVSNAGVAGLTSTSLFVTITTATGYEPHIHRAFAEVRVQPFQW